VAVTTVIIPAGPKHVHLMARAVESARAQTVPTEVLTFVDTERRGPAYGRNLLASQVTTPFLTLLDADDYLEPNFVEETLNAWVLCNIRLVTRKQAVYRTRAVVLSISLQGGRTELSTPALPVSDQLLEGPGRDGRNPVRRGGHGFFL
jgi:hypothetical protein